MKATRVRPVTLADVARLANVSLVTASRALNATSVVAEATRDRVLDAATRLGYAPNLLARGLAHRSSCTIGVIIHELANPFFAPMVSEIERVATARDFLVVVGESGRVESAEWRYVERFLQLRVGGIIVHPATREVEHLRRARERGVAVVVLARRWEDGDFVTIDNIEGGALAARHFLSRNHRRIGLACSGDPDNVAVQERASGFRESLRSAGVALPEAWDIRTRKTSFGDGAEAADRVLRLSDRPTAMFAATDRMAMGMIHRLLELGVRVPDDIAVVGFDDIPFAVYARVPLTTIAIPIGQIGNLVAEILFGRMDHLDFRETRQVVLMPDLVIRASCP